LLRTGSRQARDVRTEGSFAARTGARIVALDTKAPLASRSAIRLETDVAKPDL
jgi:hypothetical protein